MTETHFYLAPSCGSVPESLRHWYFDDYSRDEVACIARVDIYSVDDAGNKTHLLRIN